MTANRCSNARQTYPSFGVFANVAFHAKFLINTAVVFHRVNRRFLLLT